MHDFLDTVNDRNWTKDWKPDETNITEQQNKDYQWKRATPGQNWLSVIHTRADKRLRDLDPSHHGRRGSVPAYLWRQHNSSNRPRWRNGEQAGWLPVNLTQEYECKSSMEYLLAIITQKWTQSSYRCKLLQQIRENHVWIRAEDSATNSNKNTKWGSYLNTFQKPMANVIL